MPSQDEATATRSTSTGPEHRATARFGPSTLIAAVAVLVALAALALAGWAVQRSAPTPSSGPENYTEPERAAAKAKTCEAFDLVRRGVSRNTNVSPPEGAADFGGMLAVAANARISLYDGGQYLLLRLDPAAPSDVADPVRTFANVLMDIGAAATAGAIDGDPDQIARLTNADELNTTIGQLCA